MGLILAPLSVTANNQHTRQLEEWPCDFDSKGNVRSPKVRRDKDPAPLVWAHGVAMEEPPGEEERDQRSDRGDFK